MMVQELIDQDTSRWNQQLIANIYTPKEATAMNSLLLSDTNQMDVQI
jgi:hypothetical protein